MVIGFDGSRAFTENRTGTENYSYQIIKHLALIDVENIYLIYIRPGVKIKDKWPKNFEFKVINYKKLWTQIGLAKQTFIDKIDVLFVPAHTLPIFRKPGLKTVVTVHDLGSEYLPKFHQLKQRLYLSFMQKVQLKNASRLIAVSNATKEDLVKKIGINPNKIEVIYEGYDKDKFQVPGFKSDVLVNSLMHYNLEPKTYYLFVGTVQPRKNLTRLIKAFSRVILRAKPEESLTNVSSAETSSEILRYAQDDELKLVIAGSKGWLSDQIYRLPKELGIEDKVKFLGYVPDASLPALYKGAIALIFPSLFEGFGLPIIEAQACDCPVITSNISSMAEVAGKGAILVDPYNIDDIVKGMERLQVRGYRLELIKKGLENIKRFSWEKAARETLKVILSS